jgi:hypothetical protein
MACLVTNTKKHHLQNGFRYGGDIEDFSKQGLINVFDLVANKIKSKLIMPSSFIKSLKKTFQNIEYFFQENQLLCKANLHQ